MNPSLLGLPDYMDHEVGQRWVRALTHLWQDTTGRPIGDLPEDLETLRRWFDPVAQGARLRRELSDLPDCAEPWAGPSDPHTLAVASSKRLVTPEGRCALELLRTLPDHGGFIPAGEVVNYDRTLGAMYLAWSRHRLQSVLDLLAGTTKPLQIPAAGVVLALLVNRCTSPERALTRHAGGVQRDVLDQAFYSVVEAFADVLAPTRKKGSSSGRLVSGWMLYEAGRRLGDGFVVTDAKASAHGAVWIRSEAVEQVEEVLARDLARGHRARVTVARFQDAFDAMVRDLRRQLPNLASFGMAHERPVETARIRERMSEKLARQLAGS